MKINPRIRYHRRILLQNEFRWANLLNNFLVFRQPQLLTFYYKTEYICSHIFTTPNFCPTDIENPFAGKNIIHSSDSKYGQSPEPDRIAYFSISKQHILKLLTRHTRSTLILFTNECIVNLTNRIKVEEQVQFFC